MTPHPSSFRLDAIALGEPPGAAVLDHLRACGRCAERLAEARRAPPLLPWLDGLAAGRRRRWSGGWRLAAVLVPAMAVAVAAVVVALGVPEHGVGELRAKGAPTVTLYLKRGDAVTSWDGRTPLRTGDRIRVGIRGAGYARVSIASIPSAGGAPAILFAGALSAEGETLVPVSFRVDGRGGRETLSVILGDDAIAPAEHLAAPSGAQARRWTFRITLPEEPAR